MQGASMALQLMDTFTTFVDSLAESLDDHDASGEDLAARAYLSRFHFDRVVSAVSGETPVRLRRRILLERAAFRLVTTRATVLEVALEAGYSSNEAFTRAFRRAYGRPGVLARRSRPDPARHAERRALPPTRRPPAARERRGELDGPDEEDGGAPRLAGRGDRRPRRALTDEQLDAPIELSVEGVDDDPTLRSLLSRLVGQMDMWNAAMDSRAYDFEVERGESIESIRARLATRDRCSSTGRVR
jgi:AraC-like DNA-binding protein